MKMVESSSPRLNGSVCRVAPPISFVNANSTYIVAITPITLNGVGSMGGNGPVRVDSRLKTLQAPTPGYRILGEYLCYGVKLYCGTDVARGV